MKDKVWFGMKVTPAQKADIKRLAQKRGQSATATMLDLVQRALEEEQEIVAEPGSFLAVLGRLSIMTAHYGPFPLHLWKSQERELDAGLRCRPRYTVSSR